MTRINVIDPQELTRQHLIAEIRELPRIFTLVKSWRNTGVNYYNFKRIKKQPDAYTLGAGHMIFFADKLGYLLDRYNALCDEWRSRGYTVNQVDSAALLSGIDKAYIKGYTPTPEALQINRQRIADRLAGK